MVGGGGLNLDAKIGGKSMREDSKMQKDFMSLAVETCIP